LQSWFLIFGASVHRITYLRGISSYNGNLTVIILDYRNNNKQNKKNKELINKVYEITDLKRIEI